MLPLDVRRGAGMGPGRPPLPALERLEWLERLERCCPGRGAALLVEYCEREDLLPCRGMAAAVAAPLAAEATDAGTFGPYMGGGLEFWRTIADGVKFIGGGPG